MRHSCRRVAEPRETGWISLAGRWRSIGSLVIRHFDSALKDRVANQLVDGAVKVLAMEELSRPDEISYQNYPVRYLALAAFPLAAVKGYADFDRRCDPLRDKVQQGLLNIFEQTEFVTPRGSYHESMDYMRITWASLLLMVELQRTTTGVDPARRYSLFRNIGETYLYKLMPNGTPSREGDNEYPVLDTRDTAVIGYAVNRFKDPYSAWLLRDSGFFVKEWPLPVLDFLWNDPEVTPLEPGTLQRERSAATTLFSGSRSPGHARRLET